MSNTEEILATHDGMIESMGDIIRHMGKKIAILEQQVKNLQENLMLERKCDHEWGEGCINGTNQLARVCVQCLQVEIL